MFIRNAIIIQKTRLFLWSAGITKPLSMTNSEAINMELYEILFHIYEVWRILMAVIPKRNALFPP